MYTFHIIQNALQFVLLLLRLTELTLLSSLLLTSTQTREREREREREKDLGSEEEIRTEQNRTEQYEEKRRKERRSASASV